MTNLYSTKEHLQKNRKIKITPLIGKELTLDSGYCKYTLLGKRKVEFKRHLSTIEFTILNKEFHYELEWNREHIRLRVIHGAPFKVNGLDCVDAYLAPGAAVWFQGNWLKVTEITQQKNFVIPSQVVQSNLPIVLEGETGSGKSSLAYQIHLRSKRANGPFIALNIATLSRSLLESELFGHKKGAFTGAIQEKLGALRSANHGTLFLDEVDSLPHEIQLKLLLFLDNNRVKPVGGDRWSKIDVRIIFASGQDVSKLQQNRTWRTDFFYRLDMAYRYSLPALRDRPELIIDFCNAYIEKYNFFISKHVMDYYATLAWPGNYRQLKGHLDKKRILNTNGLFDLDEMDYVLAGVKHPHSLQFLKQYSSPPLSLKQMKKRYVEFMMVNNQWSSEVCAKKLGVSLKTIKSYL